MARPAKDAIRNMSASIYCLAGLHRLLHRGKAAILAYHRVLCPEDLHDGFIQPGMYVLADVFEQHMRLLKDAFEVLPLEDLLARWRSRTWDGNARYCAITFDDGWLDNYSNAYPILRRHGIPATIFLPTALVGTSRWFWWDALTHLLRRRRPGLPEPMPDALAEFTDRYPWLAQLGESPSDERLDGIVEKFKMVPEREVDEWVETAGRALGEKLPARRALVSWQEVEEMSASGISFGSHSCTHRILTRLSREELRTEVRDSLDSLRQRPIHAIPVFSYPNGDYSRHVVEEVQRAGYEAAVSGRFGLEGSVPEDLWGLKRIGMHNDVSRTRALFALRMSGLA